MRKISQASLEMLSHQNAVEPVNIVTVEWVPGQQAISYADRAIPEAGVAGFILELSDLESVVDLSKSGTTTSVKVRMSDIDGILKQIFDTCDIHGRSVVIYQWFKGLPITEMFSIFSGIIASPIEWREGDRTLNFDVISKIDDREVGFSVEEGDFANVPPELIGKAWPLIFGTVLNSSTLQVDKIPHGTTMIPLSLADPGLTQMADYTAGKIGEQMAKAGCLSFHGADLMFRGDLGGEGEDIFIQGQAYQRQAQDIYNKVGAQLSRDHARFTALAADVTQGDVDVIPILNGRFFLQGITTEIEISGAKFIGRFNGDNFQVDSRQGPEDTVHRLPGGRFVASGSGESVVENMQAEWDAQMADALFGTHPEASEKEKKRDPCGPHNLIIPKYTPAEPPKVQTKPWSAKAGAAVNIAASYPIRYILNITSDNQILAISARRTVGGIKTMTFVPQQYYTIQEIDYGPLRVLYCIMKQPLSTIKDADWENELFATVQSTIGPNVSQIIAWLILTYTQYFIDLSTFNHVAILVNNFPANFALYDRKNIVALVKDIAFQSCCAVWLDNGVFYIRYLPEAQAPIEVIKESDIEVGTLIIGTTSTEDLVTKMNIHWKEDNSQANDYLIILRNNIWKYGLLEKNYNFFIYNDPELIIKAATFWLIRLSNVWKRVICKTFITKLKLETMDTVQFSFLTSYLSNQPVNGIVEKATLNTNDFSIDIEAWTPVLLGTLDPYLWAYLTNVAIDLIYNIVEQQAGQFPDSGVSPLGADAQGDFNTGGFSIDTRQALSRSHSDRGDPQPQVAAVAQSVALSTINNLPKEATNNPAINSPSKAWDYKNTWHRDEQINPIQQAGTTTYMAVVQSKGGQSADITGGVEYTCDVYTKGILDNPTSDQICIQVQQDKDDEIPKGTKVIVTKVTIRAKDNTQQAQIKYIMKEPVWLKDKEDTTTGG